MPRPPLVDDGEVERPDPGLGAQVWHQQVMVAAATNHKAYAIQFNMHVIRRQIYQKIAGVPYLYTRAR